MKAEEFLKQVSDAEQHRMASIPFHGDLELVIDAMEKYAKYKAVEFGKEIIDRGVKLKLALNHCYDKGFDAPKGF